jgi:ribosomal protein S18 acetylase RimI-like enzyme
VVISRAEICSAAVLTSRCATLSAASAGDTDNASIHHLRPADEGTLLRIEPVRSVADLEATVQLFNAYAASVGVDLGYQDFSTELATLPGKYATPAGELLLARDSRGKPLGCVGLRAIEPHGCCEMKRLYVSPEARGLGLGRALVAAIIEEAVRIGYSEMRLDTLPTMDAAISVYKQAGFATIEPYYETPIAGTLFFARPLAT